MQAKVAFDVLHPTCFPADMQVVPIWHASMRAKAWPGALSKHAQKQTPERTLKTNIYIHIHTIIYTLFIPKYLEVAPRSPHFLKVFIIETGRLCYAPNGKGEVEVDEGEVLCLPTLWAATWR